jgi:hypothetical protein
MVAVAAPITRTARRFGMVVEQLAYFGSVELFEQVLTVVGEGHGLVAVVAGVFLIGLAVGFVLAFGLWPGRRPAERLPPTVAMAVVAADQLIGAGLIWYAVEPARWLRTVLVVLVVHAHALRPGVPEPVPAVRLATGGGELVAGAWLRGGSAG